VGGLAILVGVALCVLVLRAWSIQILHGPQYTSLANGQAYRTVDLAGPRGPIVDAKGRKLADTMGRIVIAADVAALGQIDTTGWHPTPDGLSSLRRMSKLAKVPVSTLVTRIRRSVVRSPFAPATVLSHPDGGLIGYLDERGSEFPGFKTTTLVSRSYPQGSLGGEFLGLLGEVSPALLASPLYAHAKPGETVGTSGIEASYDRILNGGFTRAHLRVDSQGRVVGPLEYSPTGTALPTLQLTIDARLQRAAEKAIAHGLALARANGHSDANAAAAVVMNPWTGAVYALASSPTYNQVAAAHDPAYLASLYRDPPTNPRLLDQATQGQYPTGSTFKPIVAEAAMSEGLITPYTPQLCSGSFTIGNTTFHNVEAGVYSSMSLPTALAESCDTWFYRLGDKFFLHGSQGIQTWAKKLALDPLRRSGRGDGPRPHSGVAAQGLPRVVVRRADDQPLDRPGLSAGDPAAARRRVLCARERRHRRAPARRRRDRPRRVEAAAQVPAGAQGQARRPVGDPGRPLSGRALGRGYVRLALRELPGTRRREDGYRRGRRRPQRPLVVCLVGAREQSEGRRRRAHRARRLRSRGSGTCGAGHLPGVLQAEELEAVAAPANHAVLPARPSGPVRVGYQHTQMITLCPQRSSQITEMRHRRRGSPLRSSCHSATVSAPLL
jgi:hypothetical protein